MTAEREILIRVIRLIKSDAYAASFQTMGQYRSGLMRDIAELVNGARVTAAQTGDQP